jgi:hypothetical protein
MTHRMEKIYLGSDDGRVGWSNTAGETVNPVTLVIGDSNLKPAVKEPGKFLYEGDMIMSIPGGRMADVLKVLDSPESAQLYQT